MRTAMIVLGVAIAAIASADPPISVTLRVPVEVRNLPSDVPELTVRCVIDAPSRHWEAREPVHIGAGTFVGTIPVRFTLDQYLPYDATYACFLQHGDASPMDIEATHSGLAGRRTIWTFRTEGRFPR